MPRVSLLSLVPRVSAPCGKTRLVVWSPISWMDGSAGIEEESILLNPRLASYTPARPERGRVISRNGQLMALRRTISALLAIAWMTACERSNAPSAREGDATDGNLIGIWASTTTLDGHGSSIHFYDTVQFSMDSAWLSTTSTGGVKGNVREEYRGVYSKIGNELEISWISSNPSPVLVNPLFDSKFTITRLDETALGLKSQVSVFGFWRIR